MSVIIDFDDILNFLNTYISDSKNPEFKKHEINFNTPDIFSKDEKYMDSQNLICLQLVTKSFLLHDVVNLTDKLVSKCQVKNMENNECIVLKQYFNENDFNIIQNVIKNLSDTKFVLVLSNLAFEIIENLIQPETITKAFWCSGKSPMIIITNNVFQIQEDRRPQKHKLMKDIQSKNSENFETQLLHLISAVTDISKSLVIEERYTFWIIKVNKIMFGILIPRYESKDKCLINVWPIVPAASFFNPTRSLNNLKVSDRDKSIFQLIVSSVKHNEKLNVINLKKEIMKGVTLPMLFQHRININTLYMMYFFEYLHENEDFQYAVPESDVVSFLQCTHCDVIFANIFDFVRHCWVVRQKMIYRCHLCNERVSRLSKLGCHFRQKHFARNEKNVHMDSIEETRDSDSLIIFSRRYHTKEIISAPKKRKCPFCCIVKSGLHLMRMHLRSDHMPEILQRTLIRQQNKILLRKVSWPKSHIPNRISKPITGRKSNFRVPCSRVDGYDRIRNCMNKLSKRSSNYRISRKKEVLLQVEEQLKNTSVDMNPKRVYRDEFRSLFNQDVPCPLCTESDNYFFNSIAFITHIARDHSLISSRKTNSPPVSKHIPSENKTSFREQRTIENNEESNLKSVGSVVEYANTMSEQADHIIYSDGHFEESPVRESSAISPKPVIDNIQKPDTKIAANILEKGDMTRIR